MELLSDVLDNSESNLASTAAVFRFSNQVKVMSLTTFFPISQQGDSEKTSKLFIRHGLFFCSATGCRVQFCVVESTVLQRL